MSAFSAAIEALSPAETTLERNDRVREEQRLQRCFVEEARQAIWDAAHPLPKPREPEPFRTKWHDLLEELTR